MNKTTKSSTHINQISFSLPYLSPSSSLVPQHAPQIGHTPTEKHPHLFLALLFQKCDRGFGEGFFFKTLNFFLKDVDTPYRSNSSKNSVVDYLRSCNL
jgi:hypothetical protein